MQGSAAFLFPAAEIFSLDWKAAFNLIFVHFYIVADFGKLDKGKNKQDFASHIFAKFFRFILQGNRQLSDASSSK